MKQMNKNSVLSTTRTPFPFSNKGWSTVTQMQPVILNQGISEKTLNATAL